MHVEIYMVLTKNFLHKLQVDEPFAQQHGEHLSRKEFSYRVLIKAEDFMKLTYLSSPPLVARKCWWG